MDPAALIAEIEALRAQVAERDHVIAERDHVIAERDLALELRDEEIAALRTACDDVERKLAELKYRLWVKKSERWVPPDHPELPMKLPEFPEPPPPKTLPDSAERPLVKDEPEPKPRKPRTRTASKLDHLPKRLIHSQVPADAACQRCGGELTSMGQATSRRVEWIPGHFELIEVVRDKCACKVCPGEGVWVADEPSFALRRSECGNGLLAQVLVDKFADHIPLNRQAKRMARQGVSFPTSTLSGWTRRGADLLSVVVDAIHARLMGCSWLQGDDTGYPVQDGVDGKLRRGRLWTYSDGQECVLRFSDTKEGKNPAKFLADFTGELLLVDLGSEFNLVVRQTEATRAGCWSHLRRYFFNARNHHPREAALALATIRDLFALERSIRGAELDVRRQVREQDAQPLVTDFGRWVFQLKKGVRPKSALGEAVGYATRNWDAFTVFLDHPELPMHNNLAELQLRQPVVGRKNHLFAGSEGGAKAAANLYSLTVSCMLQAIDPWEYLFDVLNRLPDHPANRVHELTPLYWRLARET